MDFLKLHYADNIVDADHDTDMKLPFKHCSAPMFLVSTIPSAKVSIEVSPTFMMVPISLSGYKNAFFSANIQNNIWQPPKAA